MIENFSRAILLLAPKFEARPDAPATFAEIMATRGRLVRPVWDGASEASIYGAPEINHAFRAWHDACHVAGQFGFDLGGEKQTCEMQVKQFYCVFPSAPSDVAALLCAEIIGQAEYFAEFGEFPEDQRAFVVDYLNRQPQRTTKI